MISKEQYNAMAQNRIDEIFCQRIVIEATESSQFYF